jgi:hypothetical protein
MSGLTYNDYYRYKTSYSSSCCQNTLAPNNVYYTTSNGSIIPATNGTTTTTPNGGTVVSNFPNANLLQLILPEMYPRGASYFPVLANRLGINPPLYLDNTYISPIELITSDDKQWMIKLNCEKFDAGGVTLGNIGECVDDFDATTKLYVDTHLPFLKIPDHNHHYNHSHNHTHNSSCPQSCSQSYTHSSHHMNYNNHYFPILANELGMSPPMYLDNTCHSPVEMIHQLCLEDSSGNEHPQPWLLNLHFHKIDLKNSVLTNAVEPTLDKDVATKHYVDRNRLQIFPTPMLPAGRKYNTLLGERIGENPPVYMDVEDSPLLYETTNNKKWKLTFQCQHIDFGASILSNVLDPVLLQDVATKHYVDISGGTNWSHYPATQNVAMNGFNLTNTLITYKYDFPSPIFNANNNTLILSGNNTSVGCWDYQLQDAQIIEHFSISNLLANNEYSILLRGPCRGLSSVECIGNGVQNVYTSWMEPIHIGPQTFVRLTIYVSDDNTIPVYLISMFAYN